MKRPTLNRFRASPGHSGLLLPPSVDKVGRAPGDQVGPGLIADIRPRQTVADSVIARDASGYGALADGIAGNCFSFDGISDYVNCGNDASIQIVGALTIGLWFRSDGFDTLAFTGKYDSTGNQRAWAIQGRSNGNIRILISGDGISEVSSQTSGPNLEDDNWHFIVSVFTPSTSLQMYIDGKLASENTTSIPAGVFNSSADLIIGAFGSGSSHFVGELSDEFVYAASASADDIAWAFRHKRLPHQRFGSLLSASDIKGYWPMSEGFQDADYTLVLDHSGNGNHGTNISGGATPASGEETIPQLLNNSFTRSIRFDGTDDDVTFTSAVADMRQDWTVALLAEIEDIAAARCLFSWANAAGDGIQISHNASGGLYVRVDVPAGANQIVSSTHTFAAGDIAHIVIAHDVSIRTLYFYVDGVAVGSGTYTGDLPNTVATVGTVGDGIDLSNAKGLVDEVAQFIRLLDSDEAAELANAGIPVDARRHSRAADLIGYWRNGWLNSVGQWDDLSSNDNHGTVNGAPDAIVLQALPDNPIRHALGGFVRQEKGFSFPADGSVRLLGPHEALNPDLDDNADGWSLSGEPYYCLASAGDGFVTVTDRTSTTCAVLIRRDLQLVTGEYYFLRLVVDEFSATVGNVGVIVGDTSPSAFYNAPGIYDLIRQFDGGTQRIQLNLYNPTNASIRVSHFSCRKVILPNLFAGGGTVSAWIRPISMGGNNVGRVVDKAGWRFNVADESAGVCDILFWHDFDGAADGQWSTTNRLLALGSWNHVVVAYDSDAVGNNPAVYVNGVSAAITEDAAPLGSAVSNASNPTYIGNDAGALNAFDGDIDRLVFHDRELNATDVLRLFNAQRDEYRV